MSNVKQVLEDFGFLWAVCPHWTSEHIVTVRRWPAAAVLVQETTYTDEWWVHTVRENEQEFSSRVIRASDRGKTIRELIGKVRENNLMQSSERIAHVIAHRTAADGKPSYALWVLPH